MDPFEQYYPPVGEAFATTMQALVESDMFARLAPRLYPQVPIGQLRDKIGALRDVHDFQLHVMAPACQYVATHTMTVFSYSGMEYISDRRPSLFISNHRDIVLDAMMLQYMLVQKGMETTHVVVGSNLFEMPLMAMLAKVNKMYGIARGGSPREYYASLLSMSAFLRHVVTKRGESAWIAQGNGRTKDGIDHTDPALLKMLSASGDRRDPVAALAQLNIVPVCVSYEWEPCGREKAREVCLRQQGPYHKQPGEDTQSIINGVIDPKGHVHFSICPPLSPTEIAETHGDFSDIAHLIDSRMESHRRIWPTNRIAYALQQGAEPKEPKEEVAHFEQYVADACIRHPQIPNYRETLIDIYAHVAAPKPADQTSSHKHKPLLSMLFALLIPLLLAACHGDRGYLDLRLRAEIDSHNKAAFLNRYRNPCQSIQEAQAALALAWDSLPDYHDGILRAYNNMAFGYYMLADHDHASQFIDSVMLLAEAPESLPIGNIRALRDNVLVECVIAQLLQTRLLQRGCRVADCYAILYGLAQEGILDKVRMYQGSNNYLYDYALMEYYIVSLTLNYHYRNGAFSKSSVTRFTANTKEQMEDMLTEVEDMRRSLRCDYAEDLSLNYALAHAYYRLAATVPKGRPHYLKRCYSYLDDNRRILNTTVGYCEYHQANVYQLEAFIGADSSIENDWQRLQTDCPQLPNSVVEVLHLFDTSTAMFLNTTDPYQHLGAVVAAAEYCLRIGDTSDAYRYYELALNDPSWHDGMAPRFESMLYDGLIRSGYSQDIGDILRWYAREVDLLAFIRQNENADFLLQEQMEHLETRNHYYTWIIAVVSLFVVLLAVLVLLLRRRSRILNIETAALQEAKRQDVERIANVEACLSVMRHDITPFLSYLANKNLSEAMRQEVIDQLLRTFANIKNWTNLTLPSGLLFQSGTFALQEVFDSLNATCANIHGSNVALRFLPTDYHLEGDRQLVEILLRNLVNNALQHTERGSVVVAAKRDTDDDKFVHITVTDTGCGMDSETLGGLFRADKTLRPSNNAAEVPSTGFGLILCKYIIKRHDDNTRRGCRIWAESQPDNGSTFHLRLVNHIP